MVTNDLKKGVRIQLRNGWYATIMDNMKGNTRLADVEGFCREIGSVYAFDIVRYQLPNGWWDDVQHTPGQLKRKKMVDATFGS